MDEVCFKCGEPAHDGVALDAYGVTGKSVCLPCVGDLAVFWMGRKKYECPSVTHLRQDYPVTSTSGTHYEMTVTSPVSVSWSGREERIVQQVLDVMRQDVQQRLGR